MCEHLCPECHGDGVVPAVLWRHAPGCNGLCWGGCDPIEVPGEAPCEACSGTGVVDDDHEEEA